MIGLGIGIHDVAEFNRRALIALRGVAFTGQITDKVFVGWARTVQASGHPLTFKQQQRLYEIVHSYRKQISDQLVIDYASERTRGYA